MIQKTQPLNVQKFKRIVLINLFWLVYPLWYAKRMISDFKNLCPNNSFYVIRKPSFMV